MDGLIGEGAGPGDDTDAALLVDVAGHDANLALSRTKKCLRFSYFKMFQVSIGLKY